MENESKVTSWRAVCAERCKHGSEGGVAQSRPDSALLPYTERAVKEALEKARDLDMNLVRAQEGRRVIDRMVGFKISPELCRVAGGKLSAGRVQSPALRLVVDREKAVSDFKSTTHYGVELVFEAFDHVTDGWKAQWNPLGWLDEGEDYFLDQEAAGRIAAVRNLTVTKYEETESRQAPPAPFTTSSLQQAASSVLKISPKRTMELAQRLYELGAITYMRTDSPNLSEEAILEIRSFASKNDWPVTPKPRTWKSKEGAQEAHEAIRPTHFEVEDAGSNGDEKALYRLIRFRALASLLVDAVYAVTNAVLEGEVDGKKVIFEARGRRLTGQGWRVALSDGQDEELEDGEAETGNTIPKLREGGQVQAVSGQICTRKTRPLPRYTEASLVRELEKRGIGRPSTYAAILENILDRGYVKLEKRQLAPTDLGLTVIKSLSGHFALLDYEFTRRLEERLDDLAEGRAEYQTVVQGFHELLETEVKGFIRQTGHACPDCGRALRHLVKPDGQGRRGYDLWSCTGYPDCRSSFVNDGGQPGDRLEKKEPIPLSDHKCADCGQALRHLVKEGPDGYDYWACSGRPDCKASYEDDNGVPGQKRRGQGAAASEFKCPKCGRPLYRRQGVSKAGKDYDFFGCADRECNATFQTCDDKPDFKGSRAKS